METPEDLIQVHRLSEAAIARMLEASVVKGREIGIGFGIAIVDAGGHLCAWRLMDGATPLAFEVVLRKARTAAYTGMPSGSFPDAVAASLAMASPDFVNPPAGIR